jgi:hypothetical protein
MVSTVKRSETKMAAGVNRFAEAGFRRKRLPHERMSKSILSGFEYNIQIPPFFSHALF